MSDKPEDREVESVEEAVEAAQEFLEQEQSQEEVDPDAKIMSMREMSYLLTNQTFAFCASIGQGLKDRYDVMISGADLQGLPPKAKEQKKKYREGYIQALNDVALGLMQYQNDIAVRAVADGLMTEEDLKQFYPSPEATAPEEDGKSE